MGRLRSISPLGAENTQISSRVAADLARKLRQAGWPVTQKALYGSTPAKVARLLVPVTAAGARERMTEKICQLAGYMPAVGEVEGVE